MKDAKRGVIRDTAWVINNEQIDWFTRVCAPRGVKHAKGGRYGTHTGLDSVHLGAFRAARVCIRLILGLQKTFVSLIN